jgi:hypothetical protein
MTPGECWLWTGNQTHGYGSIRVEGHHLRVHRVVYEAMRGPIPEGLTIDHLCRVRNCVNPAHLEPVTAVENVMRGETITGINARKTHCVHGHPFDAENTRIRPDGSRACRECKRLEYTPKTGRRWRKRKLS